MVQQDVALADRGEDVLCAARFDFGDLTVRGRDERAVLEVRAVERLQFEQYGEVERRGQAVDLFRVDAELVGEQLGEERAGRVEISRRIGGPKRRRSSSFSMALSRFSASSSSTSMSSLRVTRNERASLMIMPGNRDSRCAMMRFSIVMNPKRSSRLSSSVRSSTGTRRGMLPGIFTRAKVGFAGVRVLHQHREVQRVAGNVGERVRGVDGERREQRGRPAGGSSARDVPARW